MPWISRVAASAVLALAWIDAALATGQPVPWGIGLQDGASPLKAQIAWFHNSLLLPIITIITIFVLALLVYVMVRFNAKANPTPTRTTHNTVLEIAWTVIPILILVVIAIPSFKLLYYQDRAVNPDMTIKVTGRQWYWQYEYPDNGGFSFDSYMLKTEELKPGQAKLLEVDNRLVVPVGATVRVLVAGADVMHAFFVPSLGVQIYSVPGRLNETWFRIDKPGVYYGQCNQICGVNHAFMPIAVEALARADFDKWAEQAKKKFAGGDPAPTTVAAAPTK
jgi:cytochrome c oxidase subunit 2